MMAIKSILPPPYVSLDYPRNLSLQNTIVCINYSSGKFSVTDKGKGTGIDNERVPCRSDIYERRQGRHNAIPVI